jgi:uncharacterized oligopeptide transporter (OPT) family protein
MHMLLGAIVGWGILSPLAKSRGWAPGKVSDWETGSKGWIVWVSLAIMLADSVISLGNIALTPLVKHRGEILGDIRSIIRKWDWKGLLHIGSGKAGGAYAPLQEEASTPLEEAGPNSQEGPALSDEEIKALPEPDAPPEHLVNNRTVWIGLVLSMVFCVTSIRIVFGVLVPIYAVITAVFMALILSVMGVRALGETDLNPVSGISKLAQLFFAVSRTRTRY